MKVRVYNIGDQGEEEEQGGHKDGGRVEDEGERLALLLNLFFVTKSKSHFQIFILKASRVDLVRVDEFQNTNSSKNTFSKIRQNLDLSYLCVTPGKDATRSPSWMAMMRYNLNVILPLRDGSSHRRG